MNSTKVDDKKLNIGDIILYKNIQLLYILNIIQTYSIVEVAMIRVFELTEYKSRLSTRTSRHQFLIYDLCVDFRLSLESQNIQIL